MSKIKLDLNSEQNILNMLMESSSISEDQMSKINANSKEIGKTKLETAIELNFTDEAKIQKTLSTSYSLELISLEKKVIDPKIKKVIDLRYIQDNLLVPFEMTEGVLKIAIADASKLGLMKNLKTMTKMEPELYAGIISAVPFVDVVTTMSDETIPLTTFEYKEWGNPANEDEYNYIKSYSPYDNIKPSNYPAVLVTSSLYDSQVQYYEPAKYVPKLRENSTSDNPILMKMNLVGGHAGKSGRLNALEESSLDNAFLLCLEKYKN